MPVLFLKEVNPESNPQYNSSLPVQTSYKMDITPYGHSISGKLVTTILSVIRILLATVLLTTINITTAIKLRERLKRKITAKNKSKQFKINNLLKPVKNKFQTYNEKALRIVETTFEQSVSTERQTTNVSSKAQKKKVKKNKAETASRNITIVVMFTCFLYIFGTAPYVLAYILSFFYKKSMVLTNLMSFRVK